MNWCRIEIKYKSHHFWIKLNKTMKDELLKYWQFFIRPIQRTIPQFSAVFKITESFLNEFLYWRENMNISNISLGAEFFSWKVSCPFKSNFRIKNSLKLDNYITRGRGAIWGGGGSGDHPSPYLFTKNMKPWSPLGLHNSIRNRNRE